MSNHGEESEFSVFVELGDIQVSPRQKRSLCRVCGYIASSLKSVCVLLMVYSIVYSNVHEISKIAAEL